MRQELAILFFLDGKAEEVFQMQRTTHAKAYRRETMPAGLSALFATTAEELLPVARKYKFQQVQNYIVPAQQIHWEVLTYGLFIIFQKWMLLCI